jgi:hypothetical protein
MLLGTRFGDGCNKRGKSSVSGHWGKFLLAVPYIRSIWWQVALGCTLCQSHCEVGKYEDSEVTRLGNSPEPSILMTASHYVICSTPLPGHVCYGLLVAVS